MSDELYDPSIVSDNRSAVDIFAQSIRRVYRGELGGQRFHALVLAPPEYISGGSRSSFKYKARILPPEGGQTAINPHAILPDPCSLTYASDPVAMNDAIRLHTTFYSTYTSTATTY